MQKWEVCHVKRTTNEAAHRLAKVALSLGENHPECICDIVSIG
jgi:hypothetical protein